MTRPLAKRRSPVCISTSRSFAGSLSRNFIDITDMLRPHSSCLGTTLADRVRTRRPVRWALRALSEPASPHALLVAGRASRRRSTIAIATSRSVSEEPLRLLDADSRARNSESATTPPAERAVGRTVQVGIATPAELTELDVRSVPVPCRPSRPGGRDFLGTSRWSGKNAVSCPGTPSGRYRGHLKRLQLGGLDIETP